MQERRRARRRAPTRIATETQEGSVPSRKTQPGEASQGPGPHRFIECLADERSVAHVDSSHLDPPLQLFGFSRVHARHVCGLDHRQPGSIVVPVSVVMYP